MWRGIYINRSGEVFACCHQKPKPFGNIYDAPLTELVNSPAALGLRADSLSGDLSCYESCNLLDKKLSVPWGHEEPRIDYRALRFLHISFGEACNIRCVMCDNPQRHRANPILLDPKVVIANVDLTPFTDVMLRGGEPLFLPECLEFMDYLEKVGKRYSLLTNGLLIDDERAKRLARHAKSVIVSLNGATKRGHESVNKGSTFEKVTKNVQRLRQARDRSGSDMTLGGHMTITTSNVHEIPQFLRSFRELGFDRVNFGFVKETVPLYLATHPQLTAQLRQETTAAMYEVGGPDVDALRLELLGLWRPAHLGTIPLTVLHVPTVRLQPTISPDAENTNRGGEAVRSVIGDAVLAALRAVGEDGQALAFIRHSEREKASSSADVGLDQAPLTTRGHELACRFGRMLPKFGQVSVSHTNIVRSIQTATEIDTGFRESNSLSSSILVGKDPIFSVIYRGTIDKKLRDAYRASLRGQTFAQMWLDGEIPPTIMRPAKETLLRFVRDVEAMLRAAPPGSLRVHVGHDREIEVTRTALFGGRLSDFPMMDFLDGLVFHTSGNGRIQVRWRDRTADFSGVAPTVFAQARTGAAIGGSS